MFGRYPDGLGQRDGHVSYVKVNAVQTVHIPPVCARVRSQVRVGGNRCSVSHRARSVTVSARSITVGVSGETDRVHRQ